MEIVLEVADTVTVQIRKRPLQLSAVALWPNISLQKVFDYGLQQILNDAAAPAKTDAEVQPLVEKRIANLQAGILRASPIRTADPVAKEALKIATARINAALKKQGKEATPAEIRKLAVDLIAKRPEITEVARANVAAEQDLDVDVDLSTLDD